MQTASEKTRILLALSHLHGITTSVLKEVSELEDFENLTYGDFQSENIQIREAYEETETPWDTLLDYADDQIEIAKENGVSIISIMDENYPQLLRETSDDPTILYVKGNLKANPGKALSVIGTRDPTEHGIIITKRITQYFSEKGFTIVSGLYHGLDVVSLEAAIESKAYILCLLANSFDCVLPVHQNYIDKVLENGGAIISQFPFKTPLNTNYQKERDRLQAGLSYLMFLIQSSVNGVSLIAARAIIEYGRYLVVTTPTHKDKETERMKNGANEILCSKNYNKIIETLEFDRKYLDESMNNIICIKSKDDYPNIAKFLKAIPKRSSDMY